MGTAIRSGQSPLFVLHFNSSCPFFTLFGVKVIHRPAYMAGLAAVVG
jgi:hypothetical protein